MEVPQPLHAADARGVEAGGAVVLAPGGGGRGPAREAALKQVFTRPTDAKGSSRWLFNDASILLFTFLHYPLDLEPKNPETILPHAWQAAGKGFYAFRDHWNGPGDIVAQIYAKDGPHVGWNQAEAGCFQIYGLGHAWAWKDPVGGDHGKTGSRWQDNVVMLPDDPIDAEGHGTTASYDADPRTGTGVVTLGLDNVYKSSGGPGAEGAAGGRGRRHPRHAVVRRRLQRPVRRAGPVRRGRPHHRRRAEGLGLPAPPRPATRRHARAKRRRLPRRRRSSRTASPSPTQTPASGSRSSARPTPHHQGARGTGANPLSGIPDANEEAIHVTADDPNDPNAGDFFAVMTLQKGPAPAVVRGRRAGREGRRRLSNRPPRRQQDRPRKMTRAPRRRASLPRDSPAEAATARPPAPDCSGMLLMIDMIPHQNHGGVNRVPPLAGGAEDVVGHLVRRGDQEHARPAPGHGGVYEAGFDGQDVDALF